MREAIGTGATPQLALIEACRQLGKETYEVEFELLEEPKAKILGLFGGRPAKVRAYYDDAAENEPAQAPEKAPAKKPEAAAKPAAPERRSLLRRSRSWSKRRNRRRSKQKRNLLRRKKNRRLRRLPRRRT